MEVEMDPKELTSEDREAMDSLLRDAPTAGQEKEHRAAVDEVIPPRAPRKDRPGVRTVSLGWDN
jgi:hypothetical protein